MLYWISLSYAIFGVVTEGDVVVRAAPIAKWAMGRDILIVLNYYRRKGARIERV